MPGRIQALAALTQDGKTIASVGADQTILIHDGAKTVQTIKSPGTVAALAFSLDGKALCLRWEHVEKLGAQERGSPLLGSRTA